MVLSNLSICFRTCRTPIVAWQRGFYWNILACRVGLYIYCISNKLAKIAKALTLGFLLPGITAMTVAGTFMYSHIMNNEPDCYPTNDSGWSILLCLAIGYFLTYI